MKLAALIVAAAIAAGASAQTPMPFRLRANAPPALYGDVLMHRSASEAKAVAFKHWTHRARYTCRVCHFELDFSFARNATPVSMAANHNGAFCGACHDGKTAFGTSECARCHTGEPDPRLSAFLRLDLPHAPHGNGIDWSRALLTKQIAPVHTIFDDALAMELNTTLCLEAEWSFVSPATFPHAEHVRWLDCANCHPAIFNIRKKTTRHFTMSASLAGNFCGVCHVRVAFPMDDCRRCHPGMRDDPLGR